VLVAGIVALFVWLPRRERTEVGRSIDRQVGAAGPALYVLDGRTTRLNAGSWQATRAQLRVGSDYVALGRMREMGLRITVEVFRPDEILGVEEGHLARTGVDEFFSNTDTNVGQVLGWSAGAPGLLLRTGRGDIVFTVTPKHRGESRQMFLAIGALIGHPGPW
jgi:hypothetical protein